LRVSLGARGGGREEERGRGLYIHKERPRLAGIVT